MGELFSVPPLLTKKINHTGQHISDIVLEQKEHCVIAYTGFILAVHTVFP